MEMLRNQKFKQIIKNIDHAKYKKTTLEKYLNNDIEFKIFADEILKVLGFIKNNEFYIDKNRYNVWENIWYIILIIFYNG